MIWKPAFMRGVRSFLQGCLTMVTAFVLWLGTQSTFNWVEIKVEGSKMLLALSLAIGFGVISFLQNLIEDNWGSERIKKLKG